MSKKGYSKEEREQVGRDLLEVGLEMLSQRGLKGTTLQDILQAVGISKPFYYGNYYTSLAELVIHIINYEITLLLGKYSKARKTRIWAWKKQSIIFWIWSHIAASTIFL